MANLSYIDTLRDNMLDEVTALVDAGSGAGKLRIYDGSQPADADTAISGQTLLAELTLNDPSAGAASGGVLTFNSITSDSSADATGTASWFRVVDSDNNAVFDGDVTGSGGGGDLEDFASTPTQSEGHVCEICGKVCKTAFGLNSHRMYKHPPETGGDIPMKQGGE